MSFRTTVAIIITIALTITIMQNQDTATFSLFFVPVTIPKLIILTAMSVGGFLLGVLVSRPRKKRYTEHSSYPNNEEGNNSRPSTLSDEDRDYIS